MHLQHPWHTLSCSTSPRPPAWLRQKGPAAATKTLSPSSAAPKFDASTATGCHLTPMSSLCSQASAGNGQARTQARKGPLQLMRAAAIACAAKWQLEPACATTLQATERKHQHKSTQQNHKRIYNLATQACLAIKEVWIVQSLRIQMLPEAKLEA